MIKITFLEEITIVSFSMEQKMFVGFQVKKKEIFNRNVNVLYI